jgi:IclR family pca regulon transcriptional regulator
MSEDSNERPKDFVQSLDRGLAVIRAFGAERPRLTLSEVARETGLSRAVVRRFLLTLESLNYVGSNGRHFFLRPRVLELGYSYLSSFNVSAIAQTHIESLAARLRESCSVSVLDGGEIIYTARASTNRIMSVNLSVGHKLPAFATSMGRVLLASLAPIELDHYFATYERPKLTERTVTDEAQLRAILDQVRKQGWSLIDQELEQGVRSVATHIRDSSMKTLAAINLSAHASRVSLEELRRDVLPELIKTARAIESELLIQR